eukprot:TRINITY_DN36634_c0_g1_i1.p1 TRINITY_DN36634_c0_g1~~TRINITY_DN36634_c0_g1_i1.p1  ORF type:complete len:379 (+),score=66.57 TRINITY_DN36634_c0_g1_i1:27-1163(+)
MSGETLPAMSVAMAAGPCGRSAASSSTCVRCGGPCHHWRDALGGPVVHRGHSGSRDGLAWEWPLSRTEKWSRLVLVQDRMLERYEERLEEERMAHAFVANKVEAAGGKADLAAQAAAGVTLSTMASSGAGVGSHPVADAPTLMHLWHTAVSMPSSAYPTQGCIATILPRSSAGSTSISTIIPEACNASFDDTVMPEDEQTLRTADQTLLDCRSLIEDGETKPLAPPAGRDTRSFQTMCVLAAAASTPAEDRLVTLAHDGMGDIVGMPTMPCQRRVVPVSQEEPGVSLREGDNLVGPSLRNVDNCKDELGLLETASAALAKEAEELRIALIAAMGSKSDASGKPCTESDAEKVREWLPAYSALASYSSIMEDAESTFWM